ncbi:hypothetical protein [Flagellimonas marina]|uniref:Uncharacterized protein n=1 Tax=Flagellimonas marina TaxID=1775168 RepID=A0ABV8PIN0_9FLAO
MSKFCKVIENGNGDQLLLFLTPNDKVDGRADYVMMFGLEDDAIVTLTIGVVDWEAGIDAINKFDHARAMDILKDPMGYCEAIMK